MSFRLLLSSTPSSFLLHISSFFQKLLLSINHSFLSPCLATPLFFPPPLCLSSSLTCLSNTINSSKTFLMLHSRLQWLVLYHTHAHTHTQTLFREHTHTHAHTHMQMLPHGHASHSCLLQHTPAAAAAAAFTATTHTSTK